ncbi:MAG TPA: ribbon-helix-helix domain-containing protein [Chloroflexota bacterium]|nr:ribbon-helix-helix domain-containing protein [Chloroflexota bacterium]
MVQRTRPRITVTVDPDMLEAIDTYIQEHAGLDRSQVVDEALRTWYAQILHEALARQHAAPKSAEELAERAVWKHIRATQMTRGDRHRP